jgi:RNA polymerase sigma-70 factor (ECF subfamily)
VRRALAGLCEIYWYPLYAYVRRSGHSEADAQDLTQAFFARLLDKQDFRDVAPERGRFRSFLLASMKHFLLNQASFKRAIKRGGGEPTLSIEFDGAERRYQREPIADATPETVFAQKWALTVIDRVLQRLRREAIAAGWVAAFDRLKPSLTGDLPHGSYHTIGLELNLTEGAVKVAVHRLRRRFRRLLRADIAATVINPADVDEEIRYLVRALRPGGR